MTTENNLDTFEMMMDTVETSNRHRNTSCFEEAYPLIDKHLRRNAPLSKVLENFNSAYSLNVSIARFRQLLRARRSRSGHAETSTNVNVESSE